MDRITALDKSLRQVKRWAKLGRYDLAWKHMQRAQQLLQELRVVEAWTGRTGSLSS